MPQFDFQLALLFELLETIQTVPAAEASLLATDAGTTALSVITQTTELTNGVAADVTELCTITDVEATTTGIGVLAVDVGVAGAAIAPALGILAGVGLYALAPDFWDSVANALIEAGETIGGKVRAFVKGVDQTIGFTEETIEIFKNAFITAGIFDETVDHTFTNLISSSETNISQNFSCIPASRAVESALNVLSLAYHNCPYSIGDTAKNLMVQMLMEVSIPSNAIGCLIHCRIYKGDLQSGAFVDQFVLGLQWFTVSTTISMGTELINIRPLNTTPYTRLLIYLDPASGGVTEHESESFNYGYSYRTDNSDFENGNSIFIRTTMPSGAYELNVVDLGFGGIEESQNIQSGATLPDINNPFGVTYPGWTPYTLPDEQTKVYPLTMPVQNPNPTQQPAQNPDPMTDPEQDPQSNLDFLLDNLPLPTPGIQPQPVPDPDPDPQPEPDPIPEPQPEPVPDNPPNPNPDPGTPPLPVVPDLPSAVPANAMFTVYAPTIAQVNSFGGWLWSNNIIEQIKRIWNNPLDGIISFMKVYAVPTTGGTDTIKVGVLDSGVSSAVVTSQFVTVDCGTINIREKFYNATDYSPFVGLHLYLPFIGIVELDCDEFMAGSITVTYHIDVYTGTCLAEVKSTRTYDMPQATIVYTFSGNASQQLPLTSAEFSGALSALVGVVGGGLAIASGGGLGLLAGASGIAHAVTHEMVHIAHSGSLSANAGIMGARKPFLILTRRRSYDANGYNQIYGYPSNKTVYLANCSGYVKVKDIQLKTGATEKENAEIVSLLKSGVIM